MDVGAWLGGLSLGQYEQAFRENEIGAEILPKLTADDLKDMGVTVVGHRRKLLDAIAALPAPREAAMPSPDDVRATPAQRPPAAPANQAERRHLTVMFVDLVGSTALSSRLDPEEMHKVIRPYQNAVAGEVVRFEGYVAKFMGDGVMAYFGWPKAHEDDAERAVRAGLAIAGTVPTLVTPAGAALAVRIGIATGLVVVGDLVGEGGAREEPVVGETPNLAARLQTLAEPGGVVVPDATRRLVGALFDLRDLGPRTLKGISGPVCAFAVEGERAVEDRFAARQSGPPLALVGRDQELALLLDRWRLAVGGEGQAVLLAGEPGVGKSRIVLALRERLRAEPRTSVRYNCSPFHANSALHPVIEQLARAAGFAPGDDAPTRLARLKALVAQATNPDDVLPYLIDLLGLPPDARHALPPLTPQEKKSCIFRVLLAQLEGLARRTPSCWCWRTRTGATRPRSSCSTGWSSRSPRCRCSSS
jgi:class 3 adenylate cyclase